MKIPQPIPYQGSKRNIAKTILSFFPSEFKTLIEPFAGSAAISLAAASRRKASKFQLNDLNKPLMELWSEIIDHPQCISDDYEKLWNEQIGREKEYYFSIRDKFNETKRPDYLLYLLARCVKASVRYNSKGEFNQSPDNRRKGRLPKNMRKDIYMVSKLLKNKAVLTCEDYKSVLMNASKKDLVYMDPPYQGVCNGRDPRYYEIINTGEFISQLEILIERKVPFILSYDGRKGEKRYGKEIPEKIGVKRIEIKAGISTQSTLLGKNEITYESLYLSDALVNRLELSSEDVERITNHPCLEPKQMTLLSHGELL